MTPNVATEPAVTTLVTNAFREKTFCERADTSVVDATTVAVSKMDDPNFIDYSRYQEGLIRMCWSW
jgi:hypothetical protein